MRLLLAGFLTLVLAAPAAAADITVTTRLDSVAADGRCSLREAVTAANTNTASNGCPAGEVSTDVILLGEGLFLLSRPGASEDGNSGGDLDVVDFGPVTLRGIGRDRSVVSTDVPDRVLDVQTGAGVTIEALTITGGAAPNGANGAAGTDGGPGEPGGGIRNDGKLLLIDSAVRGNRAGRGGLGGVAAVNVGSAGGAGGDGGGIYSLGTITLTRTVVTGNRAGASGPSGPGLSGAATPHAAGAGGGIATSGLLTVTGSTVEGNHAGAGGAGGGGMVAGGNGGPGGHGGGIFATERVDLVRSTVADNFAGAGGDGPGAGTVGGSGGPGGDGGGIYGTTRLSLIGALVAGNGTGEGGRGSAGTSVMGRGGAGGNGAGLIGFGATRFESSTFVGGVLAPGGTGPVAGNGGPTGVATAAFGVGTVSLGRSIASGTCSGTIDNVGDSLGTHPSCGAPVTDPLVNARGVLGAGSPAIDATISCPAVDLAGNARPQGVTCDIGALEAPAAAVAVARTGLEFGSVTTGTAVTRSVDVSNAGLPGLPLAFSVTGDPELTLAGHTCGAALPGGASCIVTVRFAPTTPGARTGTLQIGAETLALTGTGVAPPTEPPGGSPQLPQETARCVVPRLKGKTLIAAARSLQNANCKLGTVTRRGRGRQGRVRSFSPKAGTSLPAGATVRLVLNRRPRR